VRGCKRVWPVWHLEAVGEGHSPDINIEADAYSCRITENTWQEWVQESREQIRAREAQQRINRTWDKMEKSEAEQTAEVLLGELIGEDQLEVYHKTGRVIVKGKKQDYLLRKGFIPRILKKNSVQDICIHLRDRHLVPKTDQVITDLLGFRYAEGYMLDKGNLHTEVPDQQGDCQREAAVG